MSEEFLVTGGAGFIGSQFSKRLISLGHKVTIIDNLKTGFRENVPKEAFFIEMDVFDKSLIERLDSKFHAIFHFAAQSSGEISFQDPFYDLRSNTEGTLNLLELCRKVDCRKFFFASTMSVYGQVKDVAISESHQLKPTSFYGVGKIASESYLRIYKEQYKIETCSLRLFNVYGPGQNMQNLKQGMISIYLAQAIKNKSIQVKGSLERFRDFIYIDDVVDAFIAAYDSKLTGEYNIGSGHKTIVKDLLVSIFEALKIPEKDRSIICLNGTPGDQFGIYSDITKMITDTNWRPKVPLEIGLKKFCDWAKLLN